MVVVLWYNYYRFIDIIIQMQFADFQFYFYNFANWILIKTGEPNGI